MHKVIKMHLLFKTSNQNINKCYKVHLFFSFACRYQKNTYLCIVFFIVLDLRLTKGWSTAVLLFLFPRF